MTQRIILHLDMDAFFAAIEQRDRAELRGKPVLIGHPGRRGVVATCSYEARPFGVRSAMPSTQAARLCPDAVWVAPRFQHYRDISRRLFETVDRMIPAIEQVSIDEAYGDLTGWAGDFTAAQRIAGELKQQLFQLEGLSASVGLAAQRFVAKIASDLEKPNGLVTILPEQAAARLAPLSVRVIPGIGPKLEARLRLCQVRRVGEILEAPRAWLIEQLGVETTQWLCERAAGIDPRPIEPSRTRQQISEERTYEIDLHSASEIERELLARADGVAHELRRRGLVARTITLKARDDQFRTITRSHTLDRPTDLTDELHRVAVTLWRERVDFGRRGVRLLGVGAKELVAAECVPRPLFPEEARDKRRRAAQASDTLRQRFGDDAVRPARLLRSEPRDE
jgi:DNA polymerase-4